MKRGPLVLLLAFLLGGAAFTASRWWPSRTAGGAMRMHREQDSLLPELAWLRTYLNLNDDQYARVQEAHMNYRPTCQGLCERAREADKVLHAVVQDPRLDASAALKQRAEVQVECQQAMLRHVRHTAGLMEEAQAAQYLNLLIPYVLDLRTPARASSPPGL